MTGTHAIGKFPILSYLLLLGAQVRKLILNLYPKLTNIFVAFKKIVCNVVSELNSLINCYSFINDRMLF